MRTRLLKTKILTAIAFTVVPLISAAELVVIANRELPVTSLTREELYRIYMGKTNFLPNGVKVIPVDQKVGSPSRDKFYSSVIQKSDTEVKSYWSRVIFTGQGYPPIQESDDQAVKDLVSKNPNCMGYVDKSYADSGSVKIVYTVQ